MAAAFEARFGCAPQLLAFAPGRTEIAGNHLDHQGGVVVAAALSQGVVVAAAPNDSETIHLESEGFGSFELRLDEPGGFEPQASRAGGEQGTTLALMRGICAGLVQHGLAPCGFNAMACSTVPAGSGLSSSAAFELAFAHTAHALAQGDLSSLDLALVARDAEARFFGKPCGLMDQLASACGGIVAIDFADASMPQIERLDASSFERMGLAACIARVEADHRGLTGAYAAIQADMRDAARLFGAQRLRDVDAGRLSQGIPLIRRRLGDAAALRAMHYLIESALVADRIEALEHADARAFLDATRRSGTSSGLYLRNLDAPGHELPTTCALGLCDLYLGNRGASRVHGGGFGGSIQAFMPIDDVAGFHAFMQQRSGHGCCDIVSIEPQGAHAFWL